MKADAQSREGAIWAHAALVLGAVVALDIYMRALSAFDGGGLSDFLMQTAPALPSLVFWWIPLAIGVSVAFAFGRDGLATRSVLRVATAATLLMVVLDASAPTVTYTMRSRLVTMAGESEQQLDPVRLPSGLVSSTRVAFAAVTGQLKGASEFPARPIPHDHPRRRAALAIQEGGTFALPILLALLVGAALRWMHASVVFRRQTDLRIVRFAVAWVVAPATCALMYGASERFAVAALTDGALPTILVPYVALAGFVLWAWTASGRLPAPVPVGDTEVAGDPNATSGLFVDRS